MLIEAVAIPIFEKLNLAGMDIAGADTAIWIAGHLSYIQPAIFVERNGDRIDDVRLASDQVDLESLGYLERMPFFLGG